MEGLALETLAKKDIEWIRSEADKIQDLWKKTRYTPLLVKVEKWTKEKDKDYWFRFAAMQEAYRRFLKENT